jgi:hypothetical protein
VLAGACLLGGCASPGGAPAGKPAAAAATSPLATSLAAADGTAWAVAAMGGTAENSFWELFARPAGSTRWDLVTPPGVADNGGLVAAAPPAGRRLDVAFRPSQGLSFSPLALTSDGGNTWGTGLIDAPVAAAPDALAAGTGTMLALLADGTIDQAAAPGANWTRLAAPGAIAATWAGRGCQVTGLTAVALTPVGTPLAAASCARPGSVGIFARAAGTWQTTAPELPATLADRSVRVLRLTGTPTADIAVLRAGTGAAAVLLVAWTGDGASWTVSPPLTVGPAQVSASGTGSDGAVWVLLPSGRAEIVSGPGAAWRALPTTPPGTAALAAGQGDSPPQALAVARGKLTVYALTTAGAWSKTQVITVPIQYGSSG